MEHLEIILKSTAISSFCLLSTAWIFRSWIITRLTNSIRHDYDKKLASISANFNRNLEFVKAELVKNQSNLSDLKNGALTNLTQREAALNEKKWKPLRLFGKLSKN